MEAKLDSFLISALNGGEIKASCCRHLNHWKKSLGNHCEGDHRSFSLETVVVVVVVVVVMMRKILLLLGTETQSSNPEPVILLLT
jgi:hypothetical protein